MIKQDPIASPRNILSLVALPSIGNMVFVALLFVLTFNSGQGLLGDGDTGYHIRTGEIILRTWEIPTSDPYSFHSPPLKWTAHEWLSEVIMAVVFQLSGLTGVVLFFAFLLALTHWLLYESLRSRSDDIYLCAIVTLLATACSSAHWLARPHVFSLLITLGWCHLLDRFQYKNQNTLVYMPPLMILWVNLHGGFIIGLVLIGIYFAGNVAYALISSGMKSHAYRRKAKTLLIVLLATLAASLINPFGWEILWFPIRVTSDRFLMDRVIEFLSPNFHEVLPFKYMLLAMIGALALSRSALNPIEVTLVLLLSYMALYSARHISLFAVVVSPILLKSLESIVNQLSTHILQSYRKRVGNLLAIDTDVKGFLWPVGTVLLIVGLAVGGNLRYQFSDEKFPVAAVEFMKKERITGNMFNNDEFGDYLIFTAWPEYRVFMDGRSDMYGEKYGSDYLRVANAQRGWKEVLEKYNITFVLFDTQSPLSTALLEQHDWQPIYSDRVATMFLKKNSAHVDLLEKYGGLGGAVPLAESITLP
jgi:hypothetical protein